MESICKFCKNKFKTEYNLKLHQKNAKYCISIQKSEDQNIISNIISCEYCNKEFCNDSLKRHLKTCKFKKKQYDDLKNQNEILKKETEDLKKQNQYEVDILKKEIEYLKLQVEILKDDHNCLKEIAKQPKNITNNSNNNNNKILSVQSLDLNNTDKLKEIIDNKYKLDYIFDGQKGFAHFAVEHILKDENGNLKYICTDPSRQMYKFKDTSGDIIKDIDAKKLTNFLVEGGLNNKASDMSMKWIEEDNGYEKNAKFDIMLEKASSMHKLKEDNNVFKRELATITTL